MVNLFLSVFKFISCFNFSENETRRCHRKYESKGDKRSPWNNPLLFLTWPRIFPQALSSVSYFVILLHMNCSKFLTNPNISKHSSIQECGTISISNWSLVPLAFLLHHFCSFGRISLFSRKPYLFSAIMPVINSLFQGRYGKVPFSHMSFTLEVLHLRSIVSPVDLLFSDGTLEPEPLYSFRSWRFPIWYLSALFLYFIFGNI